MCLVPCAMEGSSLVLGFEFSHQKLEPLCHVPWRVRVWCARVRVCAPKLESSVRDCSVSACRAREKLEPLCHVALVCSIKPIARKDSTPPPGGSCVCGVGGVPKARTLDQAVSGVTGGRPAVRTQPGRARDGTLKTGVRTLKTRVRTLKTRVKTLRTRVRSLCFAGAKQVILS